MAGVTEAGFVTKRFPEIQEDLQKQATALFQELTPAGSTVDTSDATLLGRLIGLSTPALTDIWEAMQQVYASFDPKSATGIALDNLVDIGGFVRRQGVAASFSGIVWGDVYVDIPANSAVRTSNTQYQYYNKTPLSLTPSAVWGVGLELLDTAVGSAYEVLITHANRSITLSTTAISGDTVASILGRLLSQIPTQPDIAGAIDGNLLRITAQQHYSGFNYSLTGDIDAIKVAKRLQFYGVDEAVPAPIINTVDTIVTSVLGWDSVSNPIKGTASQSVETDEELRLRFANSKYLRAQNTLDALYAELLEIEGVSEVKIYVNDTDLTNGIGLPPHSFSVLLLGGDDIEIASVIWQHTPAGIASKGSTSVSVATAQGQEQTVRFQRPVFVPLYVEIELTTDSDFPSGGEDAIKQDLVAHITNSQTIGGKVVYSRLFDPVNKTPGHEIVTLKIGRSAGTVAEGTVTMAYNEIPTLSATDIAFV